MASTTISPKDLVIALQTLNNEQSKELFYLLDVPLQILDGIEGNHKGNMCKIHYVQAWFDHEVKASWEKIVAGLKLIGMRALAETLATQQFSRWTPASAVVDLTPDLSSCSVMASGKNAASGPQTSESSPSSLSDRVSQVRAEIDRLSDIFSDLMSDTRDELCARENVIPSFLDRFRDRLLELPVAQKAPHAKFFHKNEDDFLMAKNTRKIFAILRRYCNYRNYEILREVIGKFCEAVLQRRMQEYCKSLEKFEKATTVDIYLDAIKASDILKTSFTKMTVKINKPASECSVHEVRKLKETITERASLHSYSMYIEEESVGSVQLELGFPASCVGWILGLFTPDFLTTNFLSDVVFGQQHLSILDWPQDKLVYTTLIQ